MSAIISFVDFATCIPDVRRGACSVWGTKFGLALTCLVAPALGFAGLPPNDQNPMPTYAQKNPQERAAIARGAYIARAADCTACHGENYAGGVPFVLPMGTVYSTNITQSVSYGIGGYNLQQFANAMRKGKTPYRHLYPAMPYPAYSAMSDQDISDLFAYMQTIDAVDSNPLAKTDMKFPFNIRPLMIGYNLINMPNWQFSPQLSDSQKRGKYLVDNLGHCGDCHTPRNATMGYDMSKYLAGAYIQGVKAPNITTDVATGIGSWRKQDIVTFLKTGVLQHQAIAGDEMGKAVYHSLQYLTDGDLMAMADYLKTVPPVKSGSAVTPLDVTRLPKPASADMTYNLLKQIDALKTAQARAKPNTGEAIYLTNCASCHGVAGEGQVEAKYPAITGLAILREYEPERLLNVLYRGAKSPLNSMPKMPAYADKLSDEQIAQVANYVRTQFGGLPASNLTGADAKKLANRQPAVPFLIANAGWLMVLGMGLGVLLLAWLLWRLLHRRKPTVQQVTQTKVVH
ncbi:cytochrome c [Moraxella atlantae]|uniref:cytochrome c n=1 Tax=Faucicola atlantae TaxID=34059 RepID=UPI0037515CE2